MLADLCFVLMSFPQGFGSRESIAELFAVVARCAFGHATPGSCVLRRFPFCAPIASRSFARAPSLSPFLPHFLALLVFVFLVFSPLFSHCFSTMVVPLTDQFSRRAA